jgi:hypothetical protein
MNAEASAMWAAGALAVASATLLIGVLALHLHAEGDPPSRLFRRARVRRKHA